MVSPDGTVPNLMSVCQSRIDDPRIEGLTWDSELFGFPVVRITTSAADAVSPRELLTQARQAGARLAYWLDESSQPRFTALELSEFGGRLVDRRVTYERLLAAAGPQHRGSLGGELRISEYVDSTVRPDLWELAIAAGELSRFRVDPNVPRRVFDTLYGRWIERSVRHEIADVVLVAESDTGGLAGFVTIGVQGDCGVIGLLAVAAAARGRGIGRALVEASLSRMGNLGLKRSSIVTQADNTAACRLYESLGYQAARREQVFHFWLSPHDE